MMKMKLITAPTSEPLTTTNVKDHCRITVSDDDTIITAMIVAARENAEEITHRALITQTWEVYLDGFPDVIDLPKNPIQSITSITYVDANGVTQTLNASQYTLDNISEPAQIVPAYNCSWPTTRDQVNSVIVRFVAGYGAAAAVPQSIKSWMLIQVANYYENRETLFAGPKINVVNNQGFEDALIWPFRLIRI